MIRAPHKPVTARTRATDAEPTKAGDHGVMALAPSMANSMVLGAIPINVASKYVLVRTPVVQSM